MRAKSVAQLIKEGPGKHPVGGSLYLTVIGKNGVKSSIRWEYAYRRKSDQKMTSAYAPAIGPGALGLADARLWRDQTRLANRSGTLSQTAKGVPGGAVQTRAPKVTPKAGDAPVKRGPRPALPVKYVPDLFAELAKDTGLNSRAIRFLILTGLRVAEVGFITHEMVDRAAKVLTIPRSLMKMSDPNRPAYRVALSDAALALISAGGTGRIFPVGSGKPDDRNVILYKFFTKHYVAKLKFLDEEGRGAGMHDEEGKPVTLHGFRSVLLSWAADDPEGRWSDLAAADKQLDHGETGRVDKAYRRNDLLVKRIPMMQAYGQFVTSKLIREA